MPHQSFELVLINPAQGQVKGTSIGVDAKPYYPSSNKGTSLVAWFPVSSITKALKKVAMKNRNFNPNGEVYLRFHKGAFLDLCIEKICNLLEV